VSPVKYELGFYIIEDGILHSHCRENLKSYIVFPVAAGHSGKFTPDEALLSGNVEKTLIRVQNI
jgi:hypothetical protein